MPIQARCAYSIIHGRFLNIAGVDYTHQLDRLRQLSQALPDSDPLHARIVEAEHKISALNALQWRWQSALDEGHQAPFPQELIQLRASELAVNLGELLIEGFGYYALASPDARLSHNEPPIGPPDVYTGVAGEVTGEVTGEENNPVAQHLALQARRATQSEMAARLRIYRYLEDGSAERGVK